MKQSSGVKVTNFTKKKNMRGVLPKWIRAEAASRGYGDAAEPLSVIVKEADVTEAFACLAQGNGSACVMAQAAKRIGAENVYFFRRTAWVDFGTGPFVRYNTTGAIYRNVIEPFDRGEQSEIVPGIYHLKPSGPGHSLSGRKKINARRTDRTGESNRSTGERKIKAHTERVVAAALVA